MNSSRPSSQQIKVARGTSIKKSVSKSWEKLSPAPSKNTSSYDKQTSNQNGVTASSEKRSAAESKAKTVLTPAPAQSRRFGFNSKPNTTGGASLPKSHAHQIQPKITNIQSQKKDSATLGGPKNLKNGSRLANVKNQKYPQNRTTSHKSFQEKTSVSSSGFLSNSASIPSYKSILRKVPSKSPISAKDEIIGSSHKDSANKLPQGTKNKQSLSKEDLMITSNRYNETSPVSDHSIEKLVEGSHENCYEEPFESSIADAVIESSKEEQRVSHMERKSQRSDKSSTNDREIIGTLDSTNKSLCLKEIGNEKFSCDEVKNSSMISEKDNYYPLNNPGSSEMSTIVFDKKTFLEEQTNKEFSEFYRNEQKVMENIFIVKSKNLATMLKAELDIMETMFLAKQEPPEIYSQIQQGALLLCSEMESETKKLIPIVKERVEEFKRLMNKPRVEELQALKSGDGDSLQTKELREISEVEQAQNIVSAKEQNYQSLERGSEKSAEVERVGEESKTPLFLGVEESEKLMKGEAQVEAQVNIEVSKASPVSHLKTSLLKFQQDKAITNMSHLPNDEGIELSFLEKIKAASQSKEKGIESSFLNEEEAIEVSVQNEGEGEEYKNPVKGEAEIEVTKRVQSEIRMPKKSSEPDLETSPLKSPDMSYLPNGGVEFSFFEKSASNSTLHDKEASEITLTDVKAGDKSIKQQQFEDMENIQKERDIEAEKKTLHQQSVRMKVLHTQETDTSKEDILESVSEPICSDDFELDEEEEDITEKIIPKHARVYITRRKR